MSDPGAGLPVLLQSDVRQSAIAALGASDAARQDAVAVESRVHWGEDAGKLAVLAPGGPVPDAEILKRLAAESLAWAALCKLAAVRFGAQSCAA